VTIFDEWGITATQFSKILKDNPSLRGMLFGYVAEIKLREIIAAFPNVSYMTKFDDHDRTRKGDLYVIYHNRAFDIEAKSLQTATVAWDETNKRWFGKAQVDASDKRTIILPDGTTMNTTLLLRGEFDILAVNCYAFENKWNFVFARNSDLPSSSFAKYTQVQKDNVIASLIAITWPPEPPFYTDLQALLAEMIEEGGGKDPKDVAADAEEIVIREDDPVPQKTSTTKQTKLF
jgi:hypothetical protein